jgi:RNA polymerase sigma factor (sigma-70 family)
MAEALRTLIETARHGDRQALNSLAGCVDRFVRMHSGALSSHVRKTYGSTVDFVLEGLAEALARLPEFEYRSDEQFYAWVSLYIRNRITDAARHESADKRAGRPLALDASSPVPERTDLSPTSLASSEELRSVLKKTILELQVEHPLEMEVVVLKLFEGKSWPAIRAHFDLSSEKRARTLFSHSLDLIRMRIKEILGPATLRDLLGMNP